MRMYFTFILLLLGNVSFSQCFFERKSINDSTIYIISYHDSLNERKIEEGAYTNDRKEGVWIKYYQDGITPKLVGSYHNGRPNGHYTKFYQNGSLKEKGNFYRNQWIDSIIRYFENGQVEYRSFHDSTGRETGLVEYFFDNGQIEYSYFVRDGKPTNIHRFNKKGEIVLERAGPVICSEPSYPKRQVGQGEIGKKAPFIVGIPNTGKKVWSINGYNRVYNAENEVWQDGVFKEGQLWDGKVYYYDQDGILVYVEIYKEGMYHSDGQL